MRYNIYLTLDERAEERLQAIRKKLAAEIPDIPGVAGKMKPHITVAVFDDTDHDQVLETFKRYANTLETFFLTLKDIKAFSGRRKVLYVEPVMTEKLKDSYMRCLEYLSGPDLVPAYRDSENWKPHVTLAKGLNGRAFRKAKEIAQNSWMPIEARIESAGLINVQKPLDVLASKRLDGN